jgi:hypothetical protein
VVRDFIVLVPFGRSESQGRSTSREGSGARSTRVGQEGPLEWCWSGGRFSRRAQVLSLPPERVHTTPDRNESTRWMWLPTWRSLISPRLSHALSASAEPGVPPSAISSIRLWHHPNAVRSLRLPRCHRACPSTALDERVSSLSRCSTPCKRRPAKSAFFERIA